MVCVEVAVSGAKRKLVWMGSKKSRVREWWIDEATTSVPSVGTDSKVLEESNIAGSVKRLANVE